MPSGIDARPSATGMWPAIDGGTKRGRTLSRVAQAFADAMPAELKKRA